ncbi:MAG: polyprenyl synthetase family protein [Muribaculaceae bacterium]|nr:polyprenyl synthetase family protein [Muribaculaceae bacterium]
MKNISSIQASIAPELKRLNDRIADTLHSSNPLMNRVIDNYLQTKGKQIRPILVILSAKMFGSVDENVISAASAVELLHNASLIHDDVVDETKLRRNSPTINGLWDNHIAVLVGDFFVSSSLAQALLTDDMRIIGAIASLGKLLSLGEIDQIYNARYHNLDEAAYFETIYRKTASLFVACIEVGAYAVNAPENLIEAMRIYANQLGLCFQIRDDIFDYFDDEKNIGKPTGNDLREGKITLPLLHVLLDPSAPDHEEMNELAMKDNLTTDEINRLIAYARNNGGIDYAYSVMENLREKALAPLASFPPSETLDALRDIFDFVIARDK